MTKLLACILVLAFSLEVATSQKLSGTKETVKDDTGVGDELNSPGSGGKGKAGKENRRKLGRQWLTIELFVVIDYSIYKKWMNFHKNNDRKAQESIKHYFTHVVQEMNDIYAGALNDQPYFIDLSLNAMYIAKTKQDSVFTEDSSIKQSATDIDGTKAMIRLLDWMDVKKNKSKVPDYDLLVLFTSYTMGVFNGLAYPGQVCLKYGVSINRDTSFIQTVDTTTHEIGHNIASHHDGTDNTCNFFHQFIMAAGRTDFEIEAFKSNQFVFSRCSKKYFNDNIQDMNEKNKNCMTNAPRSKYRENFSKYLKKQVGQTFSMDQQCKLTYGPKSYYCGAGLVGDLCWALVCHDPSTQECQEEIGIKPATGTSCGDRKWCYRGSCVADPKAPSFRDKCPYGDFKGLVRGWRSNCKSLVSEFKGKCYTSLVEKLCCKSCAAVKQARYRGCKYGDKERYCIKENCREDGYKEVCCETCRNVFVAPKRPSCKDQDRDGECGLVRGWMCHEAGVKAKCCETCRRLQQKKNGDCMYGDAATWCRWAKRDEGGFCSGAGRKVCCHSCSKQ